MEPRRSVWRASPRSPLPRKRTITTGSCQLPCPNETHDALFNPCLLVHLDLQLRRCRMAFFIPLGQKNTLAEYLILSGADNRPPMLDNDLNDSWKSFAVPIFSLGDDSKACLNKSMAFLTTVASSRFPSTNNQLKTSSNLRNHATIQDGRVTVQQVQRRQGQSYSGTGYKSNASSSEGNNPKQPRNAAWYKEKAMLAEAPEAGQLLDEEQLAFLADLGVLDGQAVQTIVPNNASFQTEDLDTYDSDYDDISNSQAVLMANISNYGSDVISEVPHSETNLNNMENQDVQAMQDFEQTLVVDFIDNKIHSDNNIISYSQYLQETQQENEKANKEQNNESVTAELERYKERVKTFKQRLNIDLSSREKMIDSQMDDMIREKLALKE
ncbi:hypothetical protein Tco_0629612 [Tanacetum coccineum]|uniref:Uncharacterized protein n=1 Tax=Tanacetum coccineum TaxID=301880 RepID=A0ABQ4WTU5_9ASTR